MKVFHVFSPVFWIFSSVPSPHPSLLPLPSLFQGVLIVFFSSFCFQGFFSRFFFSKFFFGFLVFASLICVSFINFF